MRNDVYFTEDSLPYTFDSLADLATFTNIYDPAAADLNDAYRLKVPYRRARRIPFPFSLKSVLRSWENNLTQEV